jgi:hypothetical protein
MATEKPEQDGFLAVIERKIAALRALADSYRMAVSLGALGQPGEIDLSAGSVRSDGPVDLPQGALLGKSLPAAVKLWLTAVRKKQTVREITTALKEGGVESTSPNFENVVTGALHRLKATGEVLRFKDGWALAELYPAALRSSLSKEGKASSKASKPAAKSRKVTKAKKTIKVKTRPKATSQEPSARPPAVTLPAGSGKTAFILSLLAADPQHGKTRRQLLEALAEAGMESSDDYVRVVLKRLRLSNRLERREGRYYPKAA